MPVNSSTRPASRRADDFLQLSRPRLNSDRVQNTGQAMFVGMGRNEKENQKRRNESTSARRQETGSFLVLLARRADKVPSSPAKTAYPDNHLRLGTI